MYGTREFGVIAAECEHHQGMHVNPAAAYVEFLPVKGAEIEGLHEILVTDLLNDGMPLIRYRINDCTLLGPQTCPCGRGYPLIRQITGRTMDMFYLPNGDVVPGISLQNRIIQVCPGLKKMQVIQDTLEDFRVRFVPGPEFSTKDIDILLGNLKKFFPDDVRWKLEQVTEIERERNGKTRFCISHVKGAAVATNSARQSSTLPTYSTK
jgi:phenylacetate-CoA ligase